LTFREFLSLIGKLRKYLDFRDFIFKNKLKAYNFIVLKLNLFILIKIENLINKSK